MNTIIELLIDLGFKPNRLGFTYLELTILAVYENPNLQMNQAYASIELQNHPSTGSIDSSIRNAIHSAHESGKLARLNQKMNSDVIEEFCPSNSELIMLIVSYLRTLNFGVA